MFSFALGCKKNEADIGKHDEVVHMERVLSLLPGIDNPRNSEGDFISLKSGRILYVYSHFYGTSYMDDAPAYIASRYSDDGGKTWSTTSELVVENEGIHNVMSVSLMRLRNDEIALFYMKQDGSYDNWTIMIRFSSDEGESWSEPRSFIDQPGKFLLANGRVIQLADGRLVTPVNSYSDVYSYYSDDNGRTWEPSTIMPNPDNSVTVEPAIVELKNGDIMMIMRTGSAEQYVSYSKDRGASWSPAKPSNIISASQSPASIAKIPHNNDLLLVWNYNTSADPVLKANRNPLNLAVSKDDGGTWEHIKVIEDYSKGSYCYTAIHFLDGYVLLAYFDWYTLGTTITRIKADWLYQNL